MNKPTRRTELLFYQEASGLQYIASLLILIIDLANMLVNFYLNQKYSLKLGKQFDTFFDSTNFVMWSENGL